MTALPCSLPGPGGGCLRARRSVRRTHRKEWACVTHFAAERDPFAEFPSHRHR